MRTNVVTDDWIHVERALLPACQQPGKATGQECPLHMP